MTPISTKKVARSIQKTDCLTTASLLILHSTLLTAAYNWKILEYNGKMSMYFRIMRVCCYDMSV